VALVGPLVMVVLLATLDPAAVWAQLGSVHVGWVALALALGVAQTIVSAWRWRYTARLLGLDIPLTAALAEYYLATFLNQVLPGGVLGDATRAWRHASRSGLGSAQAGPPVRAVVFERASGQLVMVGVAGISMLVAASRMEGTSVVLVAWTLVALVVFGAFMIRRLGRTGPPGRTSDSLMARTLRDGRRTLWDGRALPVQLATSTLIVASYVATYLCAARALGVETPVGEIAPLVAPVLLAMLIPFSVAGWGLREGAAAAMWAAVGMSPAEGVAISVAYGVIVLMGTLPGAAVLALGRYVPSGATGLGRSSRSNSTSAPSAK
jgi:glycosyltransferase 2 family protein